MSAKSYRSSVMRSLILAIAMIAFSVLLSVTILLQQRGTGLGGAFGGEGAVFRTKRGLEKGLFYATIAIGCLYVGTSILSLFLA